MEDDILRQIPDEELPLLRDLYKNHQETAPHVYSLICTCIIWRKKRPDSNYVTVFGATKDWLQTGTFIVLMQFSCYDLFIYSLEENCETLQKALYETKKIDWSRKMLWYSVSKRHLPTVIVFLKEKLGRTCDTVETELFVVRREQALEYEFDCPEDLYLAKLEKCHAPVINSVWPHKSENTLGYIEFLIEINPSYGLFTKSDHTLVCWVMTSPMGQMCNLQTDVAYKRKGYAMIITKAISKLIAEEGYHPLGTIVVGNVASETMFHRLGFNSVDTCTFVMRQ